MGTFEKVFNFKELAYLPETHQGLEITREVYWCWVGDRYVFSIAPHLPLSIPTNKKTVQTGTFLVYPLVELWRDLFVKKIIADYGTLNGVVIEGDLQEQSCWFNRYQAKDRKRNQVLDFLYALARFDTQKAKNLIQAYGNLTPFHILDRCYNVKIYAEQESLRWEAICDDSWGPGAVVFEIFVAGDMLYLDYSIDYDKVISSGDTGMRFLVD